MQHLQALISLLTYCTIWIQAGGFLRGLREIMTSDTRPFTATETCLQAVVRRYLRLGFTCAPEGLVQWS